MGDPVDDSGAFAVLQRSCRGAFAFCRKEKLNAMDPSLGRWFVPVSRMCVVHTPACVETETKRDRVHSLTQSEQSHQSLPFLPIFPSANPPALRAHTCAHRADHFAHQMRAGEKKVASRISYTQFGGLSSHSADPSARLGTTSGGCMTPIAANSSSQVTLAVDTESVRRPDGIRNLYRTLVFSRGEGGCYSTTVAFNWSREEGVFEALVSLRKTLHYTGNSHLLDSSEI